MRIVKHGHTKNGGQPCSGSGKKVTVEDCENRAGLRAATDSPFLGSRAGANVRSDHVVSSGPLGVTPRTPHSCGWFRVPIGSMSAHGMRLS